MRHAQAQLYLPGALCARATQGALRLHLPSPLPLRSTTLPRMFFVRGEGQEAGDEPAGRPRRRAAARTSYTTGGRVTPQEDTKERALKAILCWYHPDADKSVWRTKADWAREFGCLLYTSPSPRD